MDVIEGSEAFCEKPLVTESEGTPKKRSGPSPTTSPTTESEKKKIRRELIGPDLSSLHPLEIMKSESSKDFIIRKLFHPVLSQLVFDENNEYEENHISVLKIVELMLSPWQLSPATEGNVFKDISGMIVKWLDIAFPKAKPIKRSGTTPWPLVILFSPPAPL